MNGERKLTKRQDITDICNFDFYRQWWKQCRERRAVVLQPNLACFLFLCGAWAKNDFYIFKWKKIKRNIVFHDTWKLHEIELSVSIGKVLLGHIHSCLFVSRSYFVYHPGHICVCTRLRWQWTGCDKTKWLMKTKVFTRWPFTEQACSNEGPPAVC